MKEFVFHIQRLINHLGGPGHFILSRNIPELCETETFRSQPAFQNYHNRLQLMKESGLGTRKKKELGDFKSEVRGWVWTTRMLVTSNDCRYTVNSACKLEKLCLCESS